MLSQYHKLANYSHIIQRSFSQLSQSLFLDYQSTTPIDPRVLDAMGPYMTVRFGNPHSTSHSFGWEANSAVEVSRDQIAKLINADKSEIIFTSGATESNNLTLKGISEYYGKQRKHIITTQIEHKCILNTCRYLESKGFKVTYLPVNKKGLVNIQNIADNISKNTFLLSTIFVHNEIGVIQPIKQIGELCRKNNVLFHTDAAQAFGKTPIDVNDMKIDLMSISGHKIYAPKGVGALFIRKKPRVRLVPLFSGGGQERGFRSGTLPTHLIVGLGKAAQIAREDFDYDHSHIQKLTKRLLTMLRQNIPEIYLNGDDEHRIPGNLNISFSYVEGESLMMAIKKLSVSSGSACTSASLEPSYVLNAIGVKDELAHTSLRIGLGRFSNEEEIDIAASVIIKAVHKLRSMSPLWEMKQEGIDISKIKWAKH